MIRARPIATAVLWAGVTVATSAVAADAVATTPVAVVATIRGDAKVDTRCLEGAVTGFLAAKGIPVTWSRASGPANGPAGARLVSIDVDLSEPGRVALTFADGAGSPPVARHVTTTGGLDDVACEAVADVIESSVLALAATASERQPPPPPPSSPPAAPPIDVSRAPATSVAPPLARYALAIAYIAEPMAWGVVQSGVDIAFGLPPRSPHQRSWMHLAYSFPETVAADLAAVRWRTLSVTPLSFSWAMPARRAWMETKAWWGAEFTYVERIPLPGQPDMASGAKWTAGARFGWDVTGLVRFAVQNALFASLRLGYYGAFWSLDGAPETLFRTSETLFQPAWGIRPTLMVGVRWL